MPQYEIERSTGRCSVSGEEIQEGEEFYTVLFEAGDSFERADFSLDRWQGPPDGCFCFFKTKKPVKEKKKQLLVDDALLENLFQRLSTETEPLRIQFRFVLALILMRKRLLRYDKSTKRNGEEYWCMTLMRDKSTHEVINPELNDDQIDGVSEQLTAILHGDMAEMFEEHLDDADQKTDENVSILCDGEDNSIEENAGEDDS